MCTSVCTYTHTWPLGGSGGMLHRKMFNFRRSEIDSGALSGKKWGPSRYNFSLGYIIITSY